jgi:predicted permease
VDILNAVLPVFLVIALGYALRRSGFLPPSVDATLSRLVFHVAAPALLFQSAARTPLAPERDGFAVAVLIGASLLVALVVYLLSARTEPARRGVLAQGAFRSNMVFVGLPIVGNALGDEAVGRAAVLIGVLVVIYNLLAVLVLALPHQGGSRTGQWRSLLKDMILNPLVLGSLGGILFSVTGAQLPLVADRTLDLVGRVAMPLALIAVGAGLDLSRLRSELLVAQSISLIKLIVYPALGFGALHLLGFSGTDLAIPVLLMASPNAVVSFIMAQEMKGDAQLAAAIVMGSTLLSLPTLSGWLLFLQWWQ